MQKSYLLKVLYQGTDVKEEEIDEALTLDLIPQLESLRTLYHRNPYQNKEDDSRAKKRATVVERMLPKSFKPSVYMDFGGADGRITSEIGKRLKARNVFCVDLTSWQNMHHDDNRDHSVTFVPVVSSGIPFSTHSVNFCTVLQVLHHLPDVEYTISELYRVLRPGSYLFIRDHDVRTQEERDRINWVHYLYEMVTAKEVNWKYMDHTPRYHSAEEWVDLFKQFVPVRYQKARDDDIHRVFHLVLRKL